MHANGSPTKPPTSMPKAHWSAMWTRLIVAGLYLILSEQFQIGPRWLMLSLVALFFLPINVARWRGAFHVARWFAVGLATLMTLTVIASAVLLIQRVVDRQIDSTLLLLDGVIIWSANLLTFALWYWQIDANGPDIRRHHRYADLKTDFLFPQQTLAQADWADWSPGFIDYVFVAFNTSAAFSPTDTLVLSPRAKILMMAQASISIVVVLVLIARAINTLS